MIKNTIKTTIQQENIHIFLTLASSLLGFTCLFFDYSQNIMSNTLIFTVQCACTLILAKCIIFFIRN